MNLFGPLLFCSILITKLLDLVKSVAEEKDKAKLIKMIVFTCSSFGLGVLIAFAAPLDMFALMECPFELEWVAKLLTGLAIGSGASFIYDLFDERLA